MSGYGIASRTECRNNLPQAPEKELLVAVLDRAVLDLYGTNAPLKEEATDWIFGNGSSDWAFSFEWICEQLGLEVTAVKERIHELDIPGTVPQAHRWLRKKVQKQYDGMNQDQQSHEQRAA